MASGFGEAETIVSKAVAGYEQVLQRIGDGLLSAAKWVWDNIGTIATVVALVALALVAIVATGGAAAPGVVVAAAAFAGNAALVTGAIAAVKSGGEAVSAFRKGDFVGGGINVLEALTFGKAAGARFWREEL